MDPLTAARMKTVRDHMRLECEGDWDGVIATFAHPRYELYGAGSVFDGEEAVRGYFAASRIPFPDQANRQGVPRPHDGELRIRARHGKHHLRAPLLRPPRGGHGAGIGLTSEAACFHRADPTRERLRRGDQCRSA